MYDPPQGSATFGICASSCKINWVFLAILAEKLVGKPTASSNAFVWSDWVPPRVAASASIVVLITLLYGSFHLFIY